MKMLGIDIGTQSTKAVVLDQDGHILKSASASYMYDSPRPGWTEQDPEVWWKAVKSALKQLWKMGADPKSIESIGVTGQMHSLVALDRDAIPIRPALLWNDGRTKWQCDEMNKILGRDKIYQVTKNAVLPGFTAPKLLWLKQHEPDHFSRICHVMMPKDYINYKLSGVMAADVTDASGTSLFNVGERKWSDSLITSIGCRPEWFPAVYESAAPIGKISAAAARETGLSEGTLLAAGAGDNAAAAFGNGIYKEGTGNVSVGTSGTVFVPISGIPDINQMGANETLHIFCHCVPNMWHAMGTTLSAGLSLRWFKETWEKNSYEEALQDADVISAGADGLLFLPYINGERTPVNDPEADGMFFGIRSGHRREHFARAVIEGVAYSLKDCLSMIEEAGIQIHTLYAAGGAVKHSLWKQILADVLGFSLHVHDDREGPAAGAALLSGLAAGRWHAIDELQGCFGITKQVNPTQANKQLYQQNYQIYKQLYPAFKALNRG
ncbi:xylulokinase [Bacillus rugosus]|uniref:xylulokinase n=1 Tax=Bacillus rugosus TaxID=2715209 RepID=UPI0035A26A97